MASKVPNHPHVSDSLSRCRMDEFSWRDVSLDTYDTEIENNQTPAYVPPIFSSETNSVTKHTRWSETQVDFGDRNEQKSTAAQMSSKTNSLGNQSVKVEKKLEDPLNSDSVAENRHSEVTGSLDYVTKINTQLVNESSYSETQNVDESSDEDVIDDSESKDDENFNSSPKMEIKYENSPEREAGLKDDEDDFEVEVCPECKKSFASKSQLQKHHAVVHLIQITYCEFCSKEFKNKYLCKRHVQNVHLSEFNKQQEPCDQCEKVFKNRRLLYNHKIAVHAESDDMYCHVCGVQFKNYYSLKRHVRKCEIKPRKLPTNFVPGNKVGKAGFEEGVYDEECDRTYTAYKHYRTHRHNSHSNEPHLCKICEAALKTKETLKVHLKMKHGIEDKELLKSLTGAGFAKRGKTNESKEKEQCLTCGKEYIKAYYISTHRDRCAAGFITRGKPNKFETTCEQVQCATCGQEYSKGYYLRGHRDRCAAGQISTRPPVDPEALASLTPEVLAMYAVPKHLQAMKANEEKAKKQEEMVKKWQEKEEEQREDAELHPERYPKSFLQNNSASPLKPANPLKAASPLKSEPKKKIEHIENGIMSSIKNSNNMEADEEPFDQEEEDFKEDLAYPDVKLEVDSDSEDGSSDEEGSTGEEDTVDNEDYLDFMEQSLLDPKAKDEQDMKSIKPDPANALDWRQFCHVAEPAERKVKERKVKNPSKVYSSDTETDEKPSLCKVCGLSFTSPKFLSEHFKSAHSDQCIACPECGLAMMNLRGLRVHLKKRHNLTKEEAQEKYESLKKYRKEKSSWWSKESTETGVHICEICVCEGKPKKDYKKKSLLQHHNRNWHVKGSYLCVTCGACFELRGKLTYHNDKEHRTPHYLQPKTCPHCGLVVQRLKRHIADVHEKEECVCPQCAKVFTNMRNLADHVRHTHENEGQQFFCHICSKECISAFSLKQHVRRVHSNMATREEDYLPCPDCGKTFPCKKYLTDHIKNVHEVDNRRCELCGGNYRNRISLMKHMKTSHYEYYISTWKKTRTLSGAPSPVIKLKPEENLSSPPVSYKAGKGSYRPKTPKLLPTHSPSPVQQFQNNNEERQVQQHSVFGSPSSFHRPMLPGQDDRRVMPAPSASPAQPLKNESEHQEEKQDQQHSVFGSQTHFNRPMVPSQDHRRGPYDQCYPPVPPFLPYQFGNQ